MEYYSRNKDRKRRFQPRNNRERGTNINVNRFIAKAVESEMPNIYVDGHNFSEFDVVGPLRKNIQYKKYDVPTKIQHEAIPLILQGRDILGIASTGSGKTAAFLIPLINKMIKDSNQRCLVVEPTRELAMQIQDEFMSLARDTGIRSVLIIGGSSMYAQINILRRDPRFVVCTPGRMKDLSDRRVIDLRKINNVVLDEVDRMLDMGFIDDIKYITSRLNEKRQSLFFSATMNRKSEDIANTLLKNPVRVEIETQQAGKNVDQDIVRVRSREEKVALLTEYLKKDEFEKVLIFTRTKREADRLSDKLFDAGIKTGALHGNKGQGQRSRIIESFKRGNLSILIATDIASRGLDVNNITHVINYDVPENFDDYIHRIGRTGRAGKKGIAITFVG